MGRILKFDIFIKIYLNFKSKLIFHCSSRCTSFYIINRVGMGVRQSKIKESMSDDLPSDYVALVITSFLMTRISYCFSVWAVANVCVNERLDEMTKVCLLTDGRHRAGSLMTKVCLLTDGLHRAGSLMTKVCLLTDRRHRVGNFLASVRVWPWTPTSSKPSEAFLKSFTEHVSCSERSAVLQDFVSAAGVRLLLTAGIEAHSL